MLFHQISKKFVEQKSSPPPPRNDGTLHKPFKKNTSGDLADDPAIQTAIKHVDWNDMNDEAALAKASQVEALPALLTDTKKATEDIKGLLHLSKADA